MADPTLVAAIVGAIVTPLADRALDLIAHLYKRGRENREAAAKANLAAFAERLKLRAEVKFPDALLHAERLQLLEDSLSEPATALALEVTGRAALVTRDPAVHDVLADLILERMTSRAKPIQALIVDAAIDLMKRLSARHVDVLAVLSFVNPGVVQEVGDGSVDSVLKILDAHFFPLEDWLGSVTFEKLDLFHISSLGAAELLSGGISIHRTVDEPLTKMWPTKEKFVVTQLQKYGWFKSLDQMWKSGLDQMFLRPVGSVIGSIRRDQMLRLPLLWSFDCETPGV